MSTENEFLQKRGIVPFISFKESPKHEVKLLERKEDVIVDREGKEIEGISYIVEENGDKKRFFTRSASLLSQLANYGNGETVIIEMKSRKVGDNWRTYYIVTEPGQEVESIPEDEDIPVID